jgi:putative ABC transport system substrate-binding protein
LDKRRIKRLFRIVLAILPLLILEGCSEKAPQNYRVGILCGLEYIADAADGFKEGMAALGYLEGKNIVYDFQKTNFQPDLEERILKTFVKEKVDLILTFPTVVSIMAKQVTQGTNIPVIFTIANIEGSDLVESIRHPGGHITGPGFLRVFIYCLIGPQTPHDCGFPISEDTLLWPAKWMFCTRRLCRQGWS